jgi:hypothetical protein
VLLHFGIHRGCQISLLFCTIQQSTDEIWHDPFREDGWFMQLHWCRIFWYIAPRLRYQHAHTHAISARSVLHKMLVIHVCLLIVAIS